MKKTLRSLFALLLAVLMICTLAATALAEEPEEEEESKYPYAEDQYFEEDKELETYYTVQVSAGPFLGGAEIVRREMLDEGYDCFVYKTERGYRVMCGKFLHREDAIPYRDLIRENTDKTDAYVNEVYLPESAREDFLAGWKEDPMIVGNANFNGWETPTGAFLDLTANEEETKAIYTVQYSSGLDFKAAEKRRDELVKMGYEATVVKDWGCYLVLTGSFENREDAKAFRDQLRSSTNHWSADVRQIELPETLFK